MAHTNNNPIMASEPYTYEGFRKPDEGVAIITWTVEDILDVMAKHSIELTDENFDNFIATHLDTFTDRSVETGWDIINTLASLFADDIAKR